MNVKFSTIDFNEQEISLREIREFDYTNLIEPGQEVFVISDGATDIGILCIATERQLNQLFSELEPGMVPEMSFDCPDFPEMSIKENVTESDIPAPRESVLLLSELVV